MVPVGIFLETRDLGDHFGGWYGPVAPKLWAVEFFENRVPGGENGDFGGWGGRWEIGRKIENFDFAPNGPGMGGESVGDRFGMPFATRGPISGALGRWVGSPWAGFLGPNVVFHGISAPSKIEPFHPHRGGAPPQTGPPGPNRRCQGPQNRATHCPRHAFEFAVTAPRPPRLLPPYSIFKNLELREFWGYGAAKPT